MRRNFLFLLILFSAVGFVSKAQVQTMSGPVVVCPPGTFQGHHFVPPSDDVLSRLESKDDGEPCANFAVTYVGFSPQAQNAFQAAVDIWAMSLSSPVTIKVHAEWTNLGENVLGSAGPSLVHAGFANAPTGHFYPSALADAIAGSDQNPGGFDIVAQFNSNFNWYYGTDGNAPSNKYDLMSVVLHELGHGLGFLSSRSYDEVTGAGSLGLGAANNPIAFDPFLILGQNGTPLLSIPNGTTLGNAFTSGNVYCSSTLASAHNGDMNLKIYAPASFADGSSLSHWDEASFPAGHPQSLMTPALGPGEAIHNPGGATLGLFADMGWELCSTVDPPGCGTGSIAINGPTELCPGESTTATLSPPANIPAGGGYAIEFYNPITNDGVFLSGVGLPYTFDNDLNGVLSANQFPPFEGVYELTGHVYTDAGNAQGSICASSPSSVTVTFYTSEDPECGSAPTCDIGSLIISGSTELCPGETTTATLSTPATIPTGGGFGIEFYSPALDDGVFLYGISLPYTFDNDLNGVLSANQFPPFEGVYELTGHVYTDAGNAQGSICASSPSSVTVTFYTSEDPECGSAPTCDIGSLIISGSTELCPGETTTATLSTPATIPTGGGFGIEFYSPALDDGVFLYGISLPYTFDNDLNGVLSANQFPPFEGVYELTGHVYTDPGNASGSVCASSSASVTVTFYTESDQACNPEPTCEVSNLTISGPTELCPGETTTASVSVPSTIPAGGGFGIAFYSPALDDEVFLYGVTLPYSFDNNLNGVLSSNGLPPFEGEYQLTGHVYTDPDNASETVCASSAAPVTVTFYTESDQECNPEPTCETNSLTVTGANEICPGETTTVSLPTPATIPAGGGYAIEFYSPTLDDGVFLYGITLPYTFDNDLNGVLSSNSLPLFEGEYQLTGHVYTNPSDAQGSVCASSSASVSVTFFTATDEECIPEPICESTDLVIDGPEAICPEEITTIDAIEATTIPDGGGYAILIEGPAHENGLFLYEVELPYSFDNDLNGVLSDNGFATFEGEYEITGHVYSDAGDPQGSVCATTENSVFITFYSEEEEDCVVSTSDADNGERPVVFPNPTNDVLNISWSTVPGGTGTIRLTDIQGKNILTENATASDLIHGVELDVRSVEPGVYMLLFEYEEGHHAEKVIITR